MSNPVPPFIDPAATSDPGTKPGDLVSGPCPPPCCDCEVSIRAGFAIIRAVVDVDRVEWPNKFSDPDMSTQDAIDEINLQDLGSSVGNLREVIAEFDNGLNWNDSAAAAQYEHVLVQNVYKRAMWKKTGSPEEWETFGRILQLARAVVIPRRDRLFIRKTRITDRDNSLGEPVPGDHRGTWFSTYVIDDLVEMAVTAGTLVTFDLPPEGEIWRIYDASDKTCVPGWDYLYDATTELCLRQFTDQSGNDAETWYRRTKDLSSAQISDALVQFDTCPTPPDCRGLDLCSPHRSNSQACLDPTTFPIPDAEASAGSRLTHKWMRLPDPADKSEAVIELRIKLGSGLSLPPVSDRSPTSVEVELWDGSAWVPEYDLLNCDETFERTRDANLPVRARRRASNDWYTTPWVYETFNPVQRLRPHVRPQLGISDFFDGQPLDSEFTIDHLLDYGASNLVDYNSAVATVEFSLTTESGPATAGVHYEVVESEQAFPSPTTPPRAKFKILQRPDAVSVLKLSLINSSTDVTDLPVEWDGPTDIFITLSPA